jgi:hypothetical protein
MKINEVIQTNIQYVFAGGEPEDADEFDYVTAGKVAYDLADKAGLNILRDKEPFIYATYNGKTVGCLFVTESNQKYSFDVVINPKFQNKGIGTKLVDFAIQEYNSRVDAFDNYDYNIDVVSPIMKSILLKKGFSVLKELSPTRWLMGKK